MTEPAAKPAAKKAPAKKAAAKKPAAKTTAKPAKPATKRPAQPPVTTDLVALDDAYDGLDHLEQLFVAEYLLDRNATRAMQSIRPDMSPKVAGETGRRWLDRPHIKTAIARRARIALASLEITPERVLNELARIAFFNPARLFNADGSPIPICELHPDIAAGISGYEVAEIWEGSGDKRQFMGHMHKVKTHSKPEALRTLSTYLGLLKGDGGDGEETDGAALTDLNAFYDEVMRDAQAQRAEAESRSAAIEVMAREIDEGR